MIKRYIACSLVVGACARACRKVTAAILARVSGAKAAVVVAAAENHGQTPPIIAARARA